VGAGEAEKAYRRGRVDLDFGRGERRGHDTKGFVFLRSEVVVVDERRSAECGVRREREGGRKGAAMNARDRVF
jgi:hypothetical protein